MTPPAKICPWCGYPCPPRALRCRACFGWFPVETPRPRFSGCQILLLSALGGLVAVPFIAALMSGLPPRVGAFLLLVAIGWLLWRAWRFIGPR